MSVSKVDSLSRAFARQPCPYLQPRRQPMAGSIAQDQAVKQGRHVQVHHTALRTCRRTLSTDLLQLQSCSVEVEVPERLPQTIESRGLDRSRQGVLHPGQRL